MFRETAVSILSVRVNTDVCIFRANCRSAYSYLETLKTKQWRV